MSDPIYGVVAVGNALVDVLAATTDAFIAEQKKLHGMEKGAMTLIDEPRAVELYSHMGQAVETSGGSAANTMAGFASFGGKGGFIGKVADDVLGKVYQNDMRAQGIKFDESQFQAVGAGVKEPKIARPKNLDQAKENMRVEFRVLRVPAEALQQGDFDF